MKSPTRRGLSLLALVTAVGGADGVMRVTQQTPSQLDRPWNRYGNGNWIATAAWLRFATDPDPETHPESDAVRTARANLRPSRPM